MQHCKNKRPLLKTCKKKKKKLDKPLSGKVFKRKQTIYLCDVIDVKQKTKAQLITII